MLLGGGSTPTLIVHVNPEFVRLSYRDLEELVAERGFEVDLWVPKTSSMSPNRAIFMDEPAEAIN